MNNPSSAPNQEPSGRDAIDFLKDVAAAGPWVLQRFQPEARITFLEPRKAGDLGRIVSDKAKEGINLYWQINELGSHPTRKASRGQVSGMRFVFVDIDPPARPGMTPEEVEVSRTEIRDLLHDEDRLKAAGLPGLPTYIIDSGGGYWGFWYLIEPVPVEGHEHAHKLGGHNLWVTKVLNGLFSEPMADSCHNLDRVARLPGSVNFPDDKKLEAGRRVATARLTRKGHEAYTLDQFGWEDPGEAGLTPEELDEAMRAPLPEVELAEGDALAAVEPLRTQYNLGEATIQRILLGEKIDGEHEPDDKTRSGNLYNALRAMYYCGVPQAVAIKVVLDKRFGIADAVWRPFKKDRRSGKSVMSRNSPAEAAREAKAQVIKAYADAKKAEAKRKLEEETLAGPTNTDEVLGALEDTSDNVGSVEEAAAPASNGSGTMICAIRKLNEQHALLLQEGGKVKVLSWEKDQLADGRKIPLLQSPEAFKMRYNNQLIELKTKDGSKFAKLGTAWLEHPKRRDYLGLRLYPGRDRVVDGYLNLWEGFGVKPAPGNWLLMAHHIEQIMADGCEKSSEYIIKWLAWAVQNPDKMAEAAIVFKGGEGTGKGTLGYYIRKMFGQHGFMANSNRQITGNFNLHLRDTCFLFADEAIAPGDRHAESVLKSMITESELPIEGKGLNIIRVPNYLHIMMASNEDWVVPAGMDGRRFAVFQLSSKQQKNLSYFAALRAQMNNGGCEAMLHDLLGMDLGDWHPRSNIPNTKALQEQKEHSLRGVPRVMFDLLREGELPSNAPFEDTQKPFVPTSTLVEYAQRQSNEKITSTAVGRFLNKQLGVEQVTSRRPRGYRFPALAKAREAWDKVFGKVEWNDAAEWSERAFGVGSFVQRTFNGFRNAAEEEMYQRALPILN